MYFETLGRLPELEEILQSGQCYSVGQLAVNGRDLIAAGIEPGKAIGESLEYLLQAVMKGKVENDKGAVSADRSKRSVFITTKNIDVEELRRQIMCIAKCLDFNPFYIALIILA